LGEISDALRRARIRQEPAGGAPSPVEREPRREFSISAAPGALAREPVAIPASKDDAWTARAVLADPRGEAAERYRQFAIRLQRFMRERNARSICLTSAVRSEGKTTTACNLALALASMASGRRAALIELDLRRPSAAKALGITPPVGIELVLAGRAQLEEARIRTQYGDLDLFAVGEAPADPLSLVSAPSTGQLLRELARQFDLLLIDSPPALPVPDIGLLMPHVDAALLVVRSGVSRISDIREALGLLDTEKLLGVFLNEGKSPVHRRYYGYQGD
jgi:capsular exopolysaccharide synthesis family protein